MEKLRSHPKPTMSEILQEEPSDLWFTRPPGESNSHSTLRTIHHFIHPICKHLYWNKPRSIMITGFLPR